MNVFVNTFKILFLDTWETAVPSSWNAVVCIIAMRCVSL